MQQKKVKQTYTIPLEYSNGMVRNIKVKAKDRETAERRAMKFNPSAKGVKRNA